MEKTAEPANNWVEGSSNDSFILRRVVLFDYFCSIGQDILYMYRQRDVG
jgi:hypothetical protein